MKGMDRRRRPADSVNRSFEKALNRRAPWIGRQELLNAVCACAAYAVADCLVSSSFKTLDVAHLRLPDADDRAEKSISKRPAGCLKSSHGGAGVVSDFFFAKASGSGCKDVGMLEGGTSQRPYIPTSILLCVVPQFRSSHP
jgi:hypothetical protein